MNIKTIGIIQISNLWIIKIKCDFPYLWGGDIETSMRDWTTGEIEEWFDKNGISDVTFLVQHDIVVFTNEDDAILFYLAYS